jgi:hypothetical protein
MASKKKQSKSMFPKQSEEFFIRSRVPEGRLYIWSPILLELVVFFHALLFERLQCCHQA